MIGLKSKEYIHDHGMNLLSQAGWIGGVIWDFLDLRLKGTKTIVKLQQQSDFLKKKKTETNSKKHHDQSLEESTTSLITRPALPAKTQKQKQMEQSYNISKLFTPTGMHVFRMW